MSEFYFSNKDKMNKPSCDCGCNCGCNCGCGSVGPMPVPDPCSAKCTKYTEISNKKCEEASHINEQANEVAKQAAAMEQRAEQLQAEANRAACQALALWNKYNQLSDESASLLKEAQKALEEGIRCQKKCNADILYDSRPCCSDCKPCCKSCNIF